MTTLAYRLSRQRPIGTREEHLQKTIRQYGMITSKI